MGVQGLGPYGKICESKRKIKKTKKIKKTTKLTNTYDDSNDSPLFPLLKIEDQLILPPKF